MTEDNKPSWDGARIVHDVDGGRWYLLSDGNYASGGINWEGPYPASWVEEAYGPCVVVEDGRPAAAAAAEGDALGEFVKGLVAGDVVRATYSNDRNIIKEEN